MRKIVYRFASFILIFTLDFFYFSHFCVAHDYRTTDIRLSRIHVGTDIGQFLSHNIRYLWHIWRLSTHRKISSDCKYIIQATENGRHILTMFTVAAALQKGTFRLHIRHACNWTQCIRNSSAMCMRQPAQVDWARILRKFVHAATPAIAGKNHIFPNVQPASLF